MFNDRSLKRTELEKYTRTQYVARINAVDRILRSYIDIDTDMFPNVFGRHKSDARDDASTVVSC